MSFIHEDVTFLIKDTHFHAGEFCHPVGESKDTITRKFIAGIEMYEMSLENCPHGIARCYVAKDDVQLFSNHRKKLK